MQAIPIPTDNLYKFLALFGLVILITVILGSVYMNNSTNQQLLAYIEKMEAIEVNGQTEVKSGSMAVYEKLVEVTVKNKSFMTKALGVIGGIGFLMMWCGFQRWYSYYQPKHDQILELTIAKMELEVGGFNNSSAKNSVSASPS